MPPTPEPSKTPRTKAAIQIHESFDSEGQYRSFEYVFPKDMAEIETELQEANDTAKYIETKNAPAAWMRF